MPATFELRDAKAHLPDLIERVRLGEEIVILEAGEPVARLVPEVQPRAHLADLVDRDLRRARSGLPTASTIHCQTTCSISSRARAHVAEAPSC